MKPERLEKIKQTVARRQPTLSIVLENVHDMHNIGAVLRSCDSVGVCEIFILQTAEELRFSRLVLGKKTSAGARKWVNVNYYQNREACFKHVRQQYQRIFSTHLAKGTRSLYELDLTRPTALLFGNEQYGITPETLAFSDGNFTVPQVGMAKSLNISVACAVSLYEAYRQRNIKGLYTDHPDITPDQQKELLQSYIKKHEEGGSGGFAELIL